MTRFLALLLIGFIPLTAAHAADKDDWTGEWVLPRKPNVPIGDEKGKPLGTWSVTSSKVFSARKEHLQVRNSYSPGPKGYVLKADVMKLADAVAFFSEAIRNDANSAWAWRMRGEALILKEEHDKAISDYTEAIRLDPKCAAAFTGRGGAWSFKKELDKAIKDLNKAIRLDPEDATAFYNRGLAWIDKGENNKAIKDFTDAIRLDPKLAPAFYNRGNSWADQNEYDKAIKDYTESIRLDPNDVNVFFNRGSMWAAKKEYDKAIKDFTEAIRINPKLPVAFAARGFVKFKKKEYDKALKDFTEAIRLDPNDLTALCGLSDLYATSSDVKFRDGKKALTNATKACDLTDWKDGEALDVLAAAHAELGDFEKAVKYEKQALEDMDAEMERTEQRRLRLKLFEQKKPYREP